MNRVPQASSRQPLLLLIIAFGVFASACDGTENDRTLPPPSPPTVAQNPCPASSLASSSGRDARAQAPSKTVGRLMDGDPRGTLGDVLWRHEAASGPLMSTAVGTSRATEDIGEIAVIQDEGDLIAPANAFDLQGAGLRYTPRAGGSYDVSRTDANFRASLGDAVTLRDDDSAPRTLTFSFNFYGSPQSAAFVNSDGNITFGEWDTAATARSVSRLLSGPPRIAPFFADLDPSAGGTVFVRSAADAFTVTWCGVRVFESSRQVTLQTSLFPDGTIEMKFTAAPPWSAVDGIVAISPGRTTAFTAVDLIRTATAPIADNTGAIGERFAGRPDLDLVALSRKFYRTHGDAYDQLVVWTDEVMTPEGAFAFEVTVANGISGIGLDRFNGSGQFGSLGQLSSLVQMDAIGKFPDDPTTRFLGENSTVSVMGQEVGHRWLAFLRFSDHNRQSSAALLGRDESHWSFFFNSDASVMEGNRIQDLGGGNFRTVAAVEHYSLLDQYAMGLVRDTEVPPTFYVESPTNVAGNAAADSPPRVGTTFSGTRRDVLINDVIEIMGVRQPSAENSPRVIRQAFLFVVSRGRTAAPSDVAKVERIRRGWETFFTQATSGRARAETRLSAGT
jgi:hypothetical protein